MNDYLREGAILTGFVLLAGTYACLCRWDYALSASDAPTRCHRFRNVCEWRIEGIWGPDSHEHPVLARRAAKREAERIAYDVLQEAGRLADISELNDWERAQIDDWEAAAGAECDVGDWRCGSLSVGPSPFALEEMNLYRVERGLPPVEDWAAATEAAKRERASR